MPDSEMRLLEFVAALAAPRTVAQLRTVTVEALPSVVRCSLASWNEIDADAGRFDVVIHPQPDVDSHAATQRLLSLVHEHPVISYVRATGDGRPMAISDFIDARQFRASALYRDVYREVDTADQMSFTLPDPYLLIGIALHRPRRDFTTRDRRALNFLRPHLTHAHRNALAWERLHRALATLERRTEDSGASVIVLDALGRVEYRSPAAAGLLARWFPADCGDDNTLPAELAPCRSSRSVIVPTTPFITTREGHSLIVERLPIPDGDGTALLLSTHETTPTQLRKLGLSDRQTEVLILAADGGTNANIGHRLGISHRTVEKHLQLAYAQLGTPSRVTATRLVHRITSPPAT